ncbi:MULTISPECIES: lipocalin family protein [Chryseobacterium]|uniref:Lipocalin-like domain-containing protein n=1 Tax=Chryseobacterium camelliae TaxID=1265445 RepID=A0ABU0THL5_9FLAO|nr:MULTISPECIES: lipocalin family protein [Chryseobacterium]MDT3406482.1 hypothetical protein [Pseudacidovorax intermedius]MDQ1095720.1 hypothetical protein [Chryseobacterium camelliae]MDQ1099656.1 hypothetical protein [Chryseobacterium sp. SORGH_AS_1048]MDR6087005.1 hypothetical protein [Chryseobacterium sp. SORGH_AS_0909]MDR6131377.1 hypothetical protein [Chryseobacterium sp. SORGH_AS_1175]
MKKQLLLFAFSALALTSCNDDDIQGYELDMMKGDWKEVKKEVISGKDNKTVLSTSTPTGCAANDTYYFSIDYSTSYTYYSGNGTNCQINGKTEGTYTYDTDTKDLNIKYLNDSERKYKVVILTSTELKLMKLFDNIDENGDQVVDVTYISYKR